MPLHVELVTQEERVFEETEADMVVVPATEGEMGILPNHAPVLTTLGFGELIVRKGNAEESFAIYGGVVDIHSNKVIVLADLAESSYAIDAEAMEQARDRAAKLAEEGLEGSPNREAVLALRRAELALKISRKVRNRPQTLRIIDDE